ncbi:MAG: DUF4288 domain-containing protein [Verrucomicrobiae bacterium]|nr:DUF4288 domain-containing protein [Verrucomicrobiae bacterium]
MAFVPDDAEWFLAQLVEEIRIQDSAKNIVHINYVLIRATTPEDAYNRAMALGEAENQSYTNPDGKEVTTRFCGLRELDVICFPLEHGCEIHFEEHLGRSEVEINQLLRNKAELEAFLPIRDRPGRPDYSSKEVVEEVLREMTAIELQNKGEQGEDANAEHAPK